MGVKKHNKLIRDKIPEKIGMSGGTATFYEATPEEFSQKLKEKLVEESNELLDANGEQIKEELADVLKVIEEIKKNYNISDEEIARLMKEKDEKAGGFDKKIILKDVIE